MPTHAAPADPSTTPVHRVEVRPTPTIGDPRATAIVREAAGMGIALAGVSTTRVYLLEAPLDGAGLDRVVDGLLTDPVTERATIGAAPAPDGAALIEVHPLPGVMDPAAQSVREAVHDLTGIDAHVSTGWRYDLLGVSPGEAAALARRVLANPVVHAIHTEPFLPDALPRGVETPFRLRHIELRDLDSDGLDRLSREAHLFLDRAEMTTIRDEFRRLGRDPTDVELETLAQTWSEHCVHKTLKATVRYRGSGAEDPIDWSGRPGHDVRPDGTVVIDNLLRSTVAAATHELIAGGVDWTLSVFVDNAGIIAFDDENAVCVKVETHNHPSAIEPYGGAATGIGGCIRDIMGTGLAASPIASTDVFCVAFPGDWGAGDRPGSAGALPPGCLHPRRVLTEAVAGVRDYGNRMGIPTVAGAVWFDNRHIGNPLVFAGCVGVMPRDRVEGHARPGDRIVALGGRTGRDGIHGATFSSAELTDTHADEFAHAVQIGNPIEQKRLLDAIMRARDAEGPDGRVCLFSAITDCGAGGFSSAVGEMGEKIGADVHLDRAPLKYDGLTYTEIWISEAQERMVLAVPPEHMEQLEAICREESVELADLGTFGTKGEDLVLNYRGEEVGRIPMRFLHDGIPSPTREAAWASTAPSPRKPATPPIPPGATDLLRALLAHPNIASKHWIIEQYDHEVQGNTAVRPLVGPAGRGPADASVIEPVPGTGKGLAIACGLATAHGDPDLGGDPYLMTLGAIDECVRNLVCAGADPDRIAILDNFCWPSCAKPENLGSLVRAAEGCYDGAKAYRTPFVSGKDSLNNQFTIPAADGRPARTIEIPPTLLITGIGIVPELRRAMTSDAKQSGSALILVGPTHASFAGSHAAMLYSGLAGDERPARVDLTSGPTTARAVAAALRSGLVLAAHDVSEGGALCAVAEMLIGGSAADAPIGARIDGLANPHAAFAEGPSRYLLEVREDDIDRLATIIGETTWSRIGTLDTSGTLAWPSGGVRVGVEDLAAVWRRPLDW